MVDDNNSSGPFPTMMPPIPPTALEPRKHGKTATMLKETTRIGVPIFMVVGGLFTGVGLLYTNLMNQFVSVKEQFASFATQLETIKRDNQEKNDRLIRLEVERGHDQAAIIDATARIQVFIDSQKRR